jgi:hypothetical protein
MNWRFTRPDHWVRFEAGEPICFFFPVQRGLVEKIQPTCASLEDDPELLRQFSEWSDSRSRFQEHIKSIPESAPTARWQKHYYRGVAIDDTPGAPDHQAKLRLAPFGRLPPSELDPAPLPKRPTARPPADKPRAVRKRDWLLQSLEAQRRLAGDAAGVEGRRGLSREEFLNRYYAPAKPVVLSGELSDWPALYLWTPEYLREKVGNAPVEYQGGRDANPAFEMEKEAHRRQAPFDQVLQAMLTGQGSNDVYITAYNSEHNAAALSVLDGDLGFIDKLLSRETPAYHGMKWIGPAGSHTPLHHDLTNNLIVQVAGAKRVRLIPASDVGRMYNSTSVYSDIRTLDDPRAVLEAFPGVRGATVYEVMLNPGDALFVPLGWWHEVRSLSFSATLTYTNFLWPNDAWHAYPHV